MFRNEEQLDLCSGSRRSIESQARSPGIDIHDTALDSNASAAVPYQAGAFKRLPSRQSAVLGIRHSDFL